MVTATRASVKLADEVWIACALLHREHPDREDFEIAEIMERARQEAITKAPRPGLYVHVVQHCVANRRANPARYRMLFETSKGHRRLFRHSDYYHPAREDGKVVPDKAEIPPEYHKLLDWYSTKYREAAHAGAPRDSILELCGLGKEIWEGVDPDEYIRQLREGWE